MTRLQKAIADLAAAVEAREAHRDRELRNVDREWAPKMARLTQEFSDADREARGA